MIKRSAEIEIKSNAQSVKTDIDGLKNSLGAIDDTPANSLDNFATASDRASQASKGMGESVLANGGAMGILNDLTGGVAMTIKDAFESMDLFTKGTKAHTIATTISNTVVGTSTGLMKAFRIALAGTGVGLLVIALVALIANFEKVSNWVKNLVPGFALVADAVGSVIEMVTDFIGVTSEAERQLEAMTKKADESLAKNKKYLQEHGDQVDQYTKKKIEAVNAYNEAIKEEGANEIALRQRMNREIKAADGERQADKDKKRKAEAEKEANHQKQLNDKARAANDKLIAEQKAYDDAYKAQKEKLNDEIEDLNDVSEQQKLDRQKARDLESINLLKGKSDTELAVLRKLNDDKYALKQKELDDKIKLETENKAKEDKEKADQIAKDLNDIVTKNVNEKTLNDAKNLEELATIQNQILAKMALEQQADLDKAVSLGATEEQLKAIKSGYDSKRLELEGQNAEASKKIKDLEEADAKRKVAAIGQTLATASAILGEHTVAGKAMAIAATTISTYQSAVDSYKGMVSAIPGPVGIAAGAVAAAASVVSGLATVKKIIATKVPGKSGGGAGAAPSAPPKPSVSFQNTAQSQISDTIQESTKERNSTPVKAYVVSQDVTTAQSMDRNIINGAKF